MRFVGVFFLLRFSTYWLTGFRSPCEDRPAIGLLIANRAFCIRQALINQGIHYGKWPLVKRLAHVNLFFPARLGSGRVVRRPLFSTSKRAHKKKTSCALLVAVEKPCASGYFCLTSVCAQALFLISLLFCSVSQPLRKNIESSFKGDGQSMLKIRVDGMAESALKSASKSQQNSKQRGDKMGEGGSSLLCLCSQSVM